MGLTEGHLLKKRLLVRFEDETIREATYTLSNEVVGQIGGQHVVGQCRSHLVGVDLQGRTYLAAILKILFSLTVKVAITPSAIRILFATVSTQSNKGSLSSCKSLL
jgi:hypothetical protein